MILLRIINKYLILMCMSFLITLISVNNSYAEKYIVDSESLFKYANGALKEKDYERAVSEFKKFIFYFPKDNKVTEARYNIAYSKYLSDDLIKCEKALKNLINYLLKEDDQIKTTKSITFKSFILLVKCYEKQRKIQLALNEFRNLSMLTEDNKILDLIHYETGWLFYKNSMFPQAEKSFQKISPEGKIRYNLSEINTSLTRGNDLNYKSPTLSGILSIIPGGGYIYSERYRDAFISFLFNGLMIYATVEAFDSGNEGLGSILAFIETGFYSGNIYGSYNAAEKYNRKIRRDFIKREKSRFKISLYPSKQHNTYMLGALLTF
ncbi:MAG: outer membrane protein assembly factor BamD [Desulfobacterales bacterium]|nr:outer membrane protein assembly factor BamD [Desulfobacterales bacterium]